MAELPSGTVTMLFTDVVGSTRLWEEHPVAMQPAMALHDDLLRTSIEGAGGAIVKKTGDGFHAAFPTAHAAVDGAVACQLALAAATFDETGPIRARMGVHSCEAESRDGDYYGSEVNRAARLMSVAHGGQILVSLATSALVRDDSVELADLGEHRLRDLTNVEHVFEVRAPGLAAGFPPLRSLDELPSNLPRQATMFVGREDEIDSIAELVRVSSLVTLTGVGGVGKTRLALQVAAEVLPHYPDGAWCCEYAPLADPGSVWETLAASLGVQASPGRSLDDAVLEHLGGRRLLLVLDNCEHLLDALARLVDDVARRAPDVTVLATSREGLGLAGERMVAVSSLGVPDDDDLDDLLRSDAVQLFADRASAANRGFTLTAQNAGSVGVLCRRLDGIPLAIELAAARARSMAPDDLVARLDQRFKLLTRGSRGAVGRQQTLRSTIDWSYDLLDPTERQALDRLSVFAGGCDLDAAEAVLTDDDLDAFDVDDVLAQLVDKSLVDADHRDGRVRYRMLETIRQYAEERLEADGDIDEVRGRHADHYVAFAETAGPQLVRRDHAEWNARVGRETDNLRAALDWAIESASVDHALRLVATLAHDTAIGDIAMEWAELAVAIPGADEHPRFPDVAAWGASGAAQLRLDFTRADELLALGDLAEARQGVASAALARAHGVTAFHRQDFASAQPFSEAWLDLTRADGDLEPIARALVFRATVLTLLGDREGGSAFLDEAIRLSREQGFSPNLAYALVSETMQMPVDDAARALVMLDEALEIARRLGGYLLAACMFGRVWFLAASSRWDDALRAVDELLASRMPLGFSRQAPFRLGAVALAALDQPEPAAVLVGVASRMGPGLDFMGPNWGPEVCDENERAIADTLGPARFAETTARGAALSFDDGVLYLRAEIARRLADPAHT